LCLANETADVRLVIKHENSFDFQENWAYKLIKVSREFNVVADNGCSINVHAVVHFSKFARIYSKIVSK
jgi:hypothetical protein